MATITKEHYIQSPIADERFSFANHSYQEYIQWTKKIVHSGRCDLHNKSNEYIKECIDANTAAESYPKTHSRHGILLIHGLMSSPMGMSSLYQYFSRQNYLVRSLLLPGHGTRPGDLLNVSAKDWLDTCRFAIKTLRDEVNTVTVIAFSAGSTMALYLSLTENNIDNLVLFAPAISLKNPRTYFYTTLCYPLHAYIPKINWPVFREETDYAKYQSIPINAVYEITHLMRWVEHHENRLKIPLYMVSTTDDETISHKKAMGFFLKQSHSRNRGIIYTADSSLILPSCLERRTSVYPEENILNFSHTSLTVAPEHPHYGRKSHYTDFAHYSNDKKPNNQEPIYQGAVSKKNLQHGPLQRLSYNPDFDYLAADIHRFLEG